MEAVGRRRGDENMEGRGRNELATRGGGDRNAK